MIYLTKNNPNWQTHPIIEELKNHANIPPPPNQEPLQQEWIKTLAKIAKTTNIHARIITTKYIQECIKIVISKYKQISRKDPKKNT